MKLNKIHPVYVFDTSGLLDFALVRTPNHADLLAVLAGDAQYLYHPISLAEMADYFHEKIWQVRQPSSTPHEIRIGIRKRRLLISTLYKHRRRDEPREYLHGRRFLPCHISFDIFSRIAHQRSQPANLCQSRRTGCTAVADITDHEILAAAEFLDHSKFLVTFISGDQMQLAAAAHLGVTWLYSKEPHRTTPFAWRSCV